MVDLSTAQNALKDAYLSVACNQLNTQTNPLLAKIKQSSSDVYGKQIIKMAPVGLNGGIGAGSETGLLPTANENNYVQFKTTLKNLYGTIEISDKAIRASANNSGAFVDLLNAEMEGLLTASKFNLGRMLYGDGSGAVGTVTAVESGVVTMDSVKNLMEGMMVDFRDESGNLIAGASSRKILIVDRVNKKVVVSGGTVPVDVIDGTVTVQGSYGNEITGLEAIFNTEKPLYGLDRKTHTWLNPYVLKDAGQISEDKIQIALDTIEENSGSTVNFIVCSWGVRRALQKLFSENKRFVDTMELNGGYKAMSYNGIPIVADRFCPEGTMYLLNTADFTLHQLCDWQWIEGEDGKVLKQMAGKPVYTATLVKYADLICARPNGQGVIYGITEA